MSIQTMKQKTQVLYQSNHSHDHNQLWMGRTAVSSGTSNGFSSNGGYRNKGRVGQSSAMSKNGTPFKGIYPKGHGGKSGNPSRDSINMTVTEASIQLKGNQSTYIKRPVLSTRGMLRTRFKWAYSGTFPNYWVQPNYTGMQTDSASQGVYIDNKSSSYVNSLDVNTTHIYENNTTSCSTQPTISTTFKSCKPYVKSLNQPTSYTTYNQYIKSGCSNPNPRQKPFPYAVQTGKGILSGGISASSNNACNTSTTYLTPPEWYTK